MNICFFGMAFDTANLGVAALGHSVVSAVSSRLPESRMTVFDHGAGTRPSSWEPMLQYCGAYSTRRWYRRESLWAIRWSCRMGRFSNAAAQLIQNADSVLDISGGDSFTDMYGRHRFRAVTLPKIIVLEQKRPLILLPQTYGPFQKPHTLRIAREIVRSSTMAWARDARSFEVLKDLLGREFDPVRHRAGVDVAFGLSVKRPPDAVVAGQLDWFEDKSTPLVGLNVSGLLLNRPNESAKRYGLKADYLEVIVQFLRQLIRNSDARVLLVPHVVTPPGHYESDVGACEAIATLLGKEAKERIRIAPEIRDPCEAKWIIAQCDWFCGTRMHSTIAALSSGVPAAAISYSPKTLGVFESCAQGTHVADPRQLDTGEVAEQLWCSWLDREYARGALAAALPQVLRQAESQMDEIVVACVSSQAELAMRVR